ncbi:MAG: hypothetical protein JXR76_07590 [Deltaproteobacteria bacterium]|nr:hypothetical protein [Deltaproteobacteria bacterium]
MKFAIVNGRKTEAASGEQGTCLHCSSRMVARPGQGGIWQWVHVEGSPCDPWLEAETRWHRQWKSRFPADWQEVPHADPASGECHIADVKTGSGLILRFQHSLLQPTDCNCREDFYGRMVWVVNGRRSEVDASCFNLGLKGLIGTEPIAYRLHWHGRGQLLRNWSDASAAVYLDFGADILWQLVQYDSPRKMGVVGPVPRQMFVDDCINGADIRTVIAR